MRSPRLPLLLLVTLPLATAASAKDLRNRPGFGFNNQFGQFSALSLRYGIPAPDAAVQLATEIDAGFSYDSVDATRNGVYLGGRVLYGLAVEDNMNLYAVAGAGVTITDATTAVSLQPGFSTEFFLFGLENLGFEANWGFDLQVGKPTSIATFGGSPGVGIRYYF
jgi:hypothetical protein